MSYYILPKKYSELTIDPSVSTEPPQCVISSSLLYYINEVNEQITNYENSHKLNVTPSDNTSDVQSLQIDSNINNEYDKQYYSTDVLSAILNPYEFVFLPVPDSLYSVSKMKPSSPIFYTFIEIINTFKLLDVYICNNTNKINTIHFGNDNNNNAIIECLNIFREDYKDNYLSIKTENISSCLDINASIHSIDFLTFELMENTYINTNSYTIALINIICTILKYQGNNGSTIIKITNIYYKPIIDILFMITRLFDKTYIIKPNMSNIITTERYIVCKNFNGSSVRTTEYSKYFADLHIFMIEFSKMNANVNIYSILKTPLPYYFLNKIEESNIIIGHQQLFVLDQLINIIKNKNVPDKLETIKKYHIQKCIQWCEKYKIPHNKFVDKVNIFLPNISGIHSSLITTTYIEQVTALCHDNCLDDILHNELTDPLI